MGPSAKFGGVVLLFFGPCAQLVQTPLQWCALEVQTAFQKRCIGLLKILFWGVGGPLEPLFPRPPSGGVLQRPALFFPCFSCMSHDKTAGTVTVCLCPCAARMWLAVLHPLGPPSLCHAPPPHTTANPQPMHPFPAQPEVGGVCSPASQCIHNCNQTSKSSRKDVGMFRHPRVPAYYLLPVLPTIGTVFKHSFGSRLLWLSYLCVRLWLGKETWWMA